MIPPVEQMKNAQCLIPPTVQTSLIDEIQAALNEVKTTYAGDFNKAVEAAERKLGVLREARKYAGIKTEKKPKRRGQRKAASPGSEA